MDAAGLVSCLMATVILKMVKFWVSVSSKTAAYSKYFLV